MRDDEPVSTLRFIRIAGIVAAFLAVANGIGDIFYQAVPDGVYDASGEFMWRISEPRLRFGAYTGLFAIALIWVGYWHVYQGIRKAGHWLALPPIIIAMCTVGIGCAFHFGLFYPALLGHQIIASSGDAAQALRSLYASMDHATVTVATVYQIAVAVFSLWLMVLIFMGRTHYPRLPQVVRDHESHVSDHRLVLPGSPHSQVWSVSGSGRRAIRRVVFRGINQASLEC